jgi:hypothetical protein
MVVENLPLVQSRAGWSGMACSGHASPEYWLYLDVVTVVNQLGDSRTRRAGGWGLAFVVLLLIGAGMANVPGGEDPVPQVRRFYEQHTYVILLSQIIEFIATLALVLFLLGLAASGLVRARRDAMLTGGAMVLASLLTLVPHSCSRCCTNAARSGKSASCRSSRI